MKIRFCKNGFYSDLFNLFTKEHFSIRKYWSGKIVNVGLDSVYLEFDFRTNWLKDMITGVSE